MKLLIPVSTLALTVSFSALVSAVKKPTFTLRCGNYMSGTTTRNGAPGPCANGCFAQNCKGKASTLTYLSDTSTKAKARKASGCVARGPCSGTSTLKYKASGGSCDEYPVASSEEGGENAILRCVPPSENSSQGGQISAYVSANSVADGDTYLYAFSLDGSVLPYCSKTTCTNDGFEFGYNGATFSDAHRTYEATTFPIFKSSGGHLIAMASEPNPLNTTIWLDGNDGGLHTIERQLSADEVHELVATYGAATS